MLLVGAGCSSSASTSGAPATTSATGPTVTTANSSSDIHAPFAIGERAGLGDWQVTVTKATRFGRSVVVDVTLLNGTTGARQLAAAADVFLLREGYTGIDHPVVRSAGSGMAVAPGAVARVHLEFGAVPLRVRFPILRLLGKPIGALDASFQLQL